MPGRGKDQVQAFQKYIWDWFSSNYFDYVQKQTSVSPCVGWNGLNPSLGKVGTAELSPLVSQQQVPLSCKHVEYLPCQMFAWKYTFYSENMVEFPNV